MRAGARVRIRGWLREQCFLMFFIVPSCLSATAFLLAQYTKPRTPSSLHLSPRPFIGTTEQGTIRNARTAATNENPLTNGKRKRERHTFHYVTLFVLDSSYWDWGSRRRIVFNVLGTQLCSPFSRSTSSQFKSRPVLKETTN